jgi:glycine betaine/proline transport system ATP-binding protein
MTADPAIRFDNVSIVFGDDPPSALPLMDQGLSREQIRERTGQVLGVHDCALEVGRGEIVALMGLSGSGKSTLLRAVNGLNPVARGRALVRDGDGWIDPHACRPAALRRLRGGVVAMVFQNVGLLPWRTVEDNVGFGLELQGVPAAERRARVRDQLALVGLQDWGACQVSELSGGMRQRVGLARAFATEAPILLMDEPFSALDPLIRSRLQDELLSLQKQLRKTILFVSHDLEEAVRLGDRIALMQGGRIVQTGAPAQVVLSPATPYVADFVEHLNPLAVLRAADVAKPCGPEDEAGRAAAALDAPLAGLLPMLAESATPLPVGPAAGGAATATVSAADVMRALGRRSAPRP